MSEEYRGFGDYILFHEIYRSELGALYRAGEVSRREKRIQRTVFLHAFDNPAVVAEAVLARKEITNQIGQVLRSSNTASDPVLGDVRGTPVLAYDYVPALPLAAVLERARAEGFPIAVDNALLILEKLSTALSSALAVDVGTTSLVHGCLHPALVDVTNEGEAIVAGFGLGESLLSVLENDEAYPQVAPYLAPEVVMAQTASKQGDVYSLGAILYELLTGERLPADPNARADVLSAPTLAYEEDPIPADILALMQRALAPRPNDRFSSAADFKKELDKLLYGGAYSPTTFNLALFMDRLFRAEIEAEEKARDTESQVDVEAYLKPEPEPVEIEEAAAPGKKGVSPAVLGIAAVAVIAVAVVAVLLIGGGGGQDRATPTPTPEEIAAREAEEDRRMREMVDSMVKKLMEEKEAEYRQEMQERQQDIVRLREQLAAKEREAQQAGGETSSDAAARQAEELREQLEKAEEAQKQREAELEAERQRRLEQARREAAQRLAKTPEPEPETTEESAVADAGEDEPASGSEDTSGEAGAVTEGAFIAQGQWDSAPVRLASKKTPEYPRQALRSRRKGVVILQVTVGANGGVESVEVLRADDDGFGIVDAIKDTVSEYRYKPAMKDGVRVTTTVTETYRYDFTK